MSKPKYGMSQRSWDKMQDWIQKNGKNKKVLAWLKNNPPPEGWSGTRAEYAYTEMPSWVLWGRK